MQDDKILTALRAPTKQLRLPGQSPAVLLASQAFGFLIRHLRLRFLTPGGKQTEIRGMHIRIAKNRLSTAYVSPEKCISSWVSRK